VNDSVSGATLDPVTHGPVDSDAVLTHPSPDAYLVLAVYGSINVGKSSLINALVGREVCVASALGGATTDVSAAHDLSVLEAPSKLEDTTYQLRDLGVRIIDTPGIAEAGDRTHHVLSLEAAKRAHLVLFVVASDLTDHEMRAVHSLLSLEKPLLLILNQADRYSPTQRTEILDAIHRKLAHDIGPENILSVAAAPLQRLIVLHEHGEHGQETLVERAGLPNVTQLRQRIHEVVSREGHQLLALPSTIRGLEVQHEQQKLSEARRKQLELDADELIESFAVGTALTIAVQPLPLVDLAAGAFGLTWLIERLANLYEAPMGFAETQEVARVLSSVSRGILGRSTLSYVGGSLLKFVPGVGTLLGGLAQAGAVGYAMTVLGHAIKIYFANGKTWGDGGLAHTLEELTQHIDKTSVSGRILQRVRARLGG